MIEEKDKDLAYWKVNAEEDYMQVPISVLRYITELETAVKNCSIPIVVVNEAEKEFKPCGEGDNVCKCKAASECGYNSEVEYCECLAPIIRTGSDNGYCANCGNDLR